MKTKNRMIKFLITGLVFTAPSLAFPQQEAVNGYYDSKNDWIVFEWINPQVGKQQDIYDAANKIKPAIHTNVTLDSSSGTFTYTFQVTNQVGATQSIDDILISHLADVFGATAPTPPSEWNSSEYKGKNAWAWARTKGAVLGIPAGKTVSGFSFKSKGLPTVVGVGFTGNRRVEFNGGPSDDGDTQEVNASFERVFQALKSQYPTKFVDGVQQKAIGPVDPPANFIAVDFIQNLISLDGQAVTNAWITNQGLSKSLVAKLDRAKKEVAACKIKAATKIVDAFLNEVREAREYEEQEERKKHGDKVERRTKNITSEGYSLMYYNGRYFLTQLEKKTNLNCPVGHNDDDRDKDDGGKKKGR